MDEPPGIFLLEAALLEFSTFYLVSFTAIILLLMTSAMISASEVAFFSLKADDLDHCRDSSDERSQHILDLLRRPRLLLATILIANNFVNVGVVTISTFLMWEMTGTRKPAETIVGIVTLLTTVAITFFGEIVPKVYATKRNMNIARLTGATWLLVEKLFRPLSYALMGMSSLIERRIAKRGYNSTVEELNQALELTTDNPETSVDEREILRGIVNFGTLSVKQVMRSRLEISTADVELDFKELLETVSKSGYSRIPVYRGTIDHIEGILYTKDLLPYLGEGKNFQWQRLLRPGFFVPETKRLDSLLRDFQSKRVHIAIVADEYGGTSGLVTLEDLIEEIIGEINDEFDEVASLYQKVDDKTYVYEGKISLHDFCKTLDLEPQYFDEVKGESESLGGLLLELSKSMPAAGDTVKHDRFTFTVLNVDEKRIKRVRVQIADATPAES
ncbi:MAG: gliding motility-associated protein GldE [Cyclobacteriaceae bacterium]|nr:gliding motility-associated protein GldE [Cyclobacteriaceae bacterium]